MLPLLTLRESKLRGNIDTMAAYCRREGVELAPHGKTTMSPELFARQFDAGSWAITAATPWQVGAMRQMGCQRILLANVLVDPAGISYIAGELSKDPEFDFYCYVDSLAGLRVMTDEMQRSTWSRPLVVLLELGHMPGRTGARTVDSALEVAQTVLDTPGLQLAGIAGFEGLIKPSHASVLSRVDDFLVEVRKLTEEADRRGYFVGRDEIIVSAGGSAYFDRVVEALTGFELSVPLRTVLRSGGYVSHDIKMYEDTSPLARRRPANEPLMLKPAMELWATIWSRPEPELAIVGFGKRDASYDYGLPAPLRVHRRGSTVATSLSAVAEITELNDQHAFLKVSPDAGLGPGDIVVFGLSHPCTAFERWRSIPLIDDSYDVIDVIATYF